MTIYINGVAQADGVADPHGAAQHTDITKEIFLPANEGYVAAGTTLALGQMASVYGTANANQPDVYFGIKVPDDFVSFTKVEAVWSTNAASGNMYWRIIATYAADGENLTSEHTDTPALGATASAGQNIVVVQEPTNPLTLTDLAIGDYLGLRFTRQATDALDTLDNTTHLLGLLFTYTANQ